MYAENRWSVTNRKTGVAAASVFATVAVFLTLIAAPLDHVPAETPDLSTPSTYTARDSSVSPPWVWLKNSHVPAVDFSTSGTKTIALAA